MKDSTKVLLWVNFQRLKQRRTPLLALPKGVPNNTRYCPVALALDARVWSSRWWVTDHQMIPAFVTPASSKPLPGFVQNFVRHFDLGRYPELTIDIGGYPRIDP